ncbi:ornithine decarboxylase [Siculibacillus lacustris]|uniref:Ornithine decarboxylase n=1 Tax=Siculibacillus lacustris TaxID=1549641 RepID=A0A4Q9VTC4_9HYPH|nr:ornithine decarboxylase [Siculibacillus lacustris]TBW38819.1 ornithine decarboxylase [Siculibacillus lacustris]
MRKFETGREAALKLRPDEPVYCFRPTVLTRDVQTFLAAFPGKTAYAVKTNGEPFVLKTVAAAGVTAFDVASRAEFEAVRAVAPAAEQLYMHPVKAVSDIRLALERYGIRTLALDHPDEFEKIRMMVQALDLDPGEILLAVRLATKGHAAYELSKKFGAAPGEAVDLLQRIDRHGFRAGLCFHVGSQVEDIATYEQALGLAAGVRDASKVPIVSIDVGGGFPAPYGRDPRTPEKAVPDPGRLIADIVTDLDRYGFSGVDFVAEPGRVMVARCLSVIVRVLLRDGKRIYINDGIWGSLSDSWTGKITLPARLIPDPARRRRNGDPTRLDDFRVCGVTCDSVDILSRPFWLPSSVDTGDFIEIGHIGAYSLSLRTRFNGFYPDTFVEVAHAFEDDRDGLEGFATVETWGEPVTEAVAGEDA